MRNSHTQKFVSIFILIGVLGALIVLYSSFQEEEQESGVRIFREFFSIPSRCLIDPKMAIKANMFDMRCYDSSGTTDVRVSILHESECDFEEFLKSAEGMVIDVVTNVERDGIKFLQLTTTIEELEMVSYSRVIKDRRYCLKTFSHDLPLTEEVTKSVWLVAYDT